MNRNILLIEPNYKNKFPPVALMKLATYHKGLGDNVVFFKGNIKDFIIERIAEKCLQKLFELNNSIPWQSMPLLQPLFFIRSLEKPLRHGFRLEDTE